MSSSPHALSPACVWARIWARAIVPAIVAAFLVVAPQAQSSASANQLMYGWSFATDIFCDTTTREISMKTVMQSSNFDPATVAYRVAYRFNNGPWTSWSNWKTFANRNIYITGPSVWFRGSGVYQFQAQYAIWTTAGWRYSANEYANHRYSTGGFTGNTNYQWCRV